jgi:hypothetical protein
MVRCTVCFWRGTLAEARSAPRVRQSDIPPAEEAIQGMYEVQRHMASLLGHPTPPPCPACGHHTVSVERRSLHPSA